MRFLHGVPALIIGDALIVADVHSGIEERLNKGGSRVSGITGGMRDELSSLLSETGASRLIVLGDAKEEIIGISEQTMQFYSSLSEQARVTVLKGNHDGGLERIASERLEVKDDEVLFEPDAGKKAKKLSFGLCHGHAWPPEQLMKCDFLVIAHQHPQIEISEKPRKSGLRQADFNYSHREQAWLIAEPDWKKLPSRYPGANKAIKLVIVPSFNPLVGSGRAGTGRGLGPLLKNNIFKLGHAKAYRLDGTCLGKLSDLGS
jgi:metallophosphoesterase superfamily enzyme